MCYGNVGSPTFRELARRLGEDTRYLGANGRFLLERHVSEDISRKMHLAALQRRSAQHA